MAIKGYAHLDSSTGKVLASELPSEPPLTATYITQANEGATLTQSRQLQGTANQVILTDGGAASTMTLSLPQSINSGASPTFTNLTLTGLTANAFAYSGTGGLITSTLGPANGEILIGSTGAAPVKATITGTTNEIVVTNGAGSITLSTPQAIGTSSSVQFGAVQLNSGRLQTSAGASVAAANNLTLGTDGNLFTITGNTQINAITTSGWQSGSVIRLLFTGTPTVKHNTAGGAGTAVLLLDGSADYVAANNTLMTFCYDGTSWQMCGVKAA